MLNFNTINELSSLHDDIGILWSTLEALSVALSDKDSPAELFQPAVRGASDRAFEIKEKLSSIIEELNQK